MRRAAWRRGEVLHAREGFQLLATVTSAPSSGVSAAGGGGSAGAYATSNMAKVRRREGAFSPSGRAITSFWALLFSLVLSSHTGHG